MRPKSRLKRAIENYLILDDLELYARIMGGLELRSMNLPSSSITTSYNPTLSFTKSAIWATWKGSWSPSVGMSVAATGTTLQLFHKPLRRRNPSRTRPRSLSLTPSRARVYPSWRIPPLIPISSSTSSIAVLQVMSPI